MYRTAAAKGAAFLNSAREYWRNNTAPKQGASYLKYEEAALKQHLLLNPSNDNINKPDFEQRMKQNHAHAFSRNVKHLDNPSEDCSGEYRFKVRNVNFKDHFQNKIFRKALKKEAKLAKENGYYTMASDMIHHAIDTYENSFVTVKNPHGRWVNLTVKETQDIETALLTAIDLGLGNVVEKGLHALANQDKAALKRFMNRRDKNGNTLLHRANGEPSSLRALLDFDAEADFETGLDVTAANKAGITALENAVQHKYTKCMKAYSDHAPFKKDILRQYFNAAASGDLRHIKTLVEEYDFDLNTKTDDELKNTAIHLAAANGHADIIEYLASKGAALNARNAKKQTAMHVFKNEAAFHALRADHLGTKKAYLNAADEDKRTGLMYKSARAEEENAQVLIDAGAKLELRDRLQNTALVYTGLAANWLKKHQNGWVNTAASVKSIMRINSMRPKLARIGQRLLDAGANINARGNHGLTVISRAMIWGHKTYANDLLKRDDVDLNIQTNQGNKYTSLAAGHGLNENIDTLMYKDADFQHENKDGNAPFDLAKLYKKSVAAVKIKPDSPDLTIKDKATYGVYASSGYIMNGMKVLVNKFNNLTRAGYPRRIDNDTGMPTRSETAPSAIAA